MFSGSFHIPNTNINQAYIDVNVSNCGQITRILGGARSTRRGVLMWVNLEEHHSEARKGLTSTLKPHNYLLATPCPQ